MRVALVRPYSLATHGVKTTYGTSLLAAFAIALSVAFVAWVIFEAVDDEESAGPDRGASIRDLDERPGDFYGDRVTVSGEGRTR